jgi:hypothetical protein
MLLQPLSTEPKDKSLTGKYSSRTQLVQKGRWGNAQAAQELKLIPMARDDSISASLVPTQAKSMVL